MITHDLEKSVAIAADREDRGMRHGWRVREARTIDLAARMAHRSLMRRGDRIALVDARAEHTVAFVRRLGWLTDRERRTEGRA